MLAVLAASAFKSLTVVFEILGEAANDNIPGTATSDTESVYGDDSNICENSPTGHHEPEEESVGKERLMTGRCRWCKTLIFAVFN